LSVRWQSLSLGSDMQGVHEVHPDSLETLVTEGIELPYVE
jgi:hypothetical protein